MTTPPDHIAALFDLPPEPEPSLPAAPSLEDEEAALAAELALALETGDIAADAPDSRADSRVQVSWPARMHLPGGEVIDLVVRNISESGMGLLSAHPIPAHTIVAFEMTVPPLAAGSAHTVVKGSIRTTYTILQASEILCGGRWVQAPAGGLGLVNQWVERLRG